MDINNVSKLGAPNRNVVIETAGRIYIKVQDRFYELDFKNSGNTASNVTNIVNTAPATDLSDYVSKEDLKSVLNSYVTTKTWQSVKATQEALENANLKGFSESINPITIDTMQLLVGAEQLQYDFVDTLGHYTSDTSDLKLPTLEGLSTIVYNVPYFSDNITLVCPSGLVKHYVYGGPEAVQSGMHDYQYLRWIVTDSTTFDLSQTSYTFNDGTDINSTYLTNDDSESQVDYADRIIIDEKIYYLYLQADYIDLETKTEQLALTTSSAAKTWFDLFVLNNNLDEDGNSEFTFSKLVKIYDALLGQKMALYEDTPDGGWGQGDFATMWSDGGYQALENTLIDLLYNFKLGTAKYVLTELPLGEYEYKTVTVDNTETEVIASYNLLYAIVGNNGSAGRSITTLNGFTEVTPGQVTAYIFKTPDGQQYINFKEGSMHIGDPYSNKKGEWMHYAKDTGLEISGQVTVTGGGLKDTLEYLDKLASGEFEIYYSDEALSGPNGQNAYYGSGYLPAWGSAPSSDDDSGDDDDEEDDGSGGEDTTSTDLSYNQYIPFPNDCKKSSDSSWYERRNWPAATWVSVQEKESHLGDLYVVSRDIPWNGGTENTVLDDVTPNYSYDSDTTAYNEAKLIFRYTKSEEPTGENGAKQNTYYWTLTDNKFFSTLINNFDDFGYLKRALNNSTTITGGLILTSAIGLGYSDVEDVETPKDSDNWVLTAGISGIVNNDPDKAPDTDIAAWYGGKMQDPIRYVAPNKPSGSSPGIENQNYTPPSTQGVRYPQTLFRHDGSGYIGGLKNNIPALQWDTTTIAIREDISVVDSSGVEIGTLGDISDFFEKVYVQNNTLYTKEDNYIGWNPDAAYDTIVRLKTKYKGVYSEGFVSAFGYSSSGSGTGGNATSINGIQVFLTNLSDGDALIYDASSGGKWVNGPAGIAAIDSPSAGDVLTWSSSGAEWIDPDSDSEGLNVLSAKHLTTEVPLWGNLFNGSHGLGTGTNGDTYAVSGLFWVGDINFSGDSTNYTVKLSTTTWGNSLPSSNNTLYVYGNIVASGYISAFGDSSQSSGSGGEATSIGGKPISINSSNLAEGDTLIYDSSNQRWINGPAGINASNSPSDTYLLGWSGTASTGSAEWLSPSSITVGEATYLANGGLTLWGNPNIGTSGNMSVGTSEHTANLSYVGNINFGSTGTSGIYLSTDTPSGTPTSSDNLYLKGNLIVSGYISAFGASSSSGGSGGNATSIGGIAVNFDNQISDGDTIIYDSNSNKWVNGSAGINWPSGASNGQLLQWSSGDAGWVSPSALSVNYATSAGSAGSASSATTASRLASSVYLWGNSFNGSQSVGTSTSAASLNYVLDLNMIRDLNINNMVILTTESSRRTYNKWANALYIDGSLNTTGNIYAIRGIQMPNNVAIYAMYTSQDLQEEVGIDILRLDDSNNLIVGYDTRSNSIDTYVDGYILRLRSGSSGTTLTLDSAHKATFSGKVIIGTVNSEVSGLSVGGNARIEGQLTVTNIFNAKSSANIDYNLTIGTTATASSGYGNLTVKGNYIYIGGTAYYLKYEANSGSPYLHTNLPIVSDGFISAYGVSTTSSGTNSGGNNSGGEPGEEPVEEPVEEPYEET